MNRPAFFVACKHRHAPAISPIQQLAQSGNARCLVCSTRRIGEPGESGKFGDG
jgi:hypothetical protein